MKHFAQIAIPCALGALLAGYLANRGYEWLVGRCFLTFFLAMMWVALIRQIRVGYLRPFYKSEKPGWFTIAKWHHTAILTAASLGCLWLWFN